MLTSDSNLGARMAKHHLNSLPFLIHRIAERLADAVTRDFRPLGLSAYAARVLILLKLDDERAVGDLAESAALDQTTLSHILRRLETQKLLSRTRQEHDNRSVLVSLTDEGRRVAGLCANAAEGHDALLRRGLSEARVAELKEMLNMLYENAPLFELNRVPSAAAQQKPEPGKATTGRALRPAKRATR